MVTSAAVENHAYYNQDEREYRQPVSAGSNGQQNYRSLSAERHQETYSPRAHFQRNSNGEQVEYHYDGSPVDRTNDDRVVISREGRRRYSNYETVPSGYHERRRMSLQGRSSSLERNRHQSSSEKNQSQESANQSNASGRHIRSLRGNYNNAATSGSEERSSKQNSADSNPGKVSSTNGSKNNSNGNNFYLTHLNMTSADVRRRLKEKEFVEEAIEGMKQQKLQKRKERLMEQKQDMEMLKSYNPWGKPGCGAPRHDDCNNKEKFIQNLHRYEDGEEADPKSILSFGKPGHGAPLRSKSGRRITEIKGDTSLRFQQNENVKKAIENQLRYKGDHESKKTYRDDLDRMMQYKEMLKKEQKEKEVQNMVQNVGAGSSLITPDWQKDPPSIKKKVYSDDPEGYNYNPWGKGFGQPERDARGNIRRYKFAPSKDHGVREFTPPATPQEKAMLFNENRGGAGAPILSENGIVKTQLPVTLDGQSAVKEMKTDETDSPQGRRNLVNESPYTGKNFIEKLGWSTSGQPHRRSNHAKKEYLDTLKQGMEEKEQKLQEEKEYNKDGGLELATLMKNKVIGKPKKDFYTGEHLDHRKKRQDDNFSNGYDNSSSKQYHDQLTYQAEEKISKNNALKAEDMKKSVEHIDSWNGIWGKPGHGAPISNENHHKGVPTELTSVPDPYSKDYTTDVLKSNHVHRYEVDSRKHIFGKKDYKFKIPYASVNSD